MEEKVNKSKQFKSIIFFLLSITWMAVIFMFSAQTGEKSGNQSSFLADLVCGIIPFELSEKGLDILIFIIRKLAHFTEYAILGILYFETIYSYTVYRGVKQGASKQGEALKNADKRTETLKTAVAVTVLCMLYAISDEFHQSFTDGRTPAVRDVIIDTCGGFAGGLAVRLIVLAKKRKMKK